MLAGVFAAGAAIAVLLLAVLMPPFEAADEFTHMDRVDQIALGGLVARRGPGGHDAGGRIDSGIARVDAIVGTVRWHPERRVTTAALADAGRIGWGDRRWTDYDNTAIYAPILYLPSVVAVLIGKSAHLSIVRTLELARVLSGLVSVAVAALAIGCAGDAAPVLFVVLSLPMSLGLFASVSQDGPMLACAALGAALLNRVGRDPTPGRAPLALLATTLALLGLGRPAYAPVALVLPALRRYGIGARALAFGAVLVVIGAWSALTTATTLVNYLPDVDPDAQLRALLADPAQVLRIAIATWNGKQGMEGLAYWREIIGVLGWIDAPLPSPAYPVMLAFLLIGTVLALPGRRSPLEPAASVALTAGLLGATVLVFALEYLTWTTVGAPTVVGVQGRYFLPVLLFVPLLLPPLGRFRPEGMIRLGQLALLAAPAIGTVAAVLAVVHRYDVPPG